MELICRAGRPRIATWTVACLAGAFSAAAALAYLAYMANGLAAGAIIGLPGREVDAAVAQHHAIAVFQLGVVIALFSLLQFGAEANPLVRFASRGAVATFLSFVTTLVVGVLIFEMLDLLRPHLR